MAVAMSGIAPLAQVRYFASRWDVRKMDAMNNAAVRHRAVTVASSISRQYPRLAARYTRVNHSRNLSLLSLEICNINSQAPGSREAALCISAVMNFAETPVITRQSPLRGIQAVLVMLSQPIISRMALMARAMWTFTVPLLMPIVEAIWPSRRPR
jgi:hypothetical protein